MPVPLRAPQRITGLVMKISKKIAEACHEIFPPEGIPSNSVRSRRPQHKMKLRSERWMHVTFQQRGC